MGFVKKGQTMSEIQKVFKNKKRKLYACKCKTELFSSNYLIDVFEGQMQFSQSLVDLTLIQTRLEKHIYKEVFCPNCNQMLGLLFIDSSHASQKRFNIFEENLIPTSPC